MMIQKVHGIAMRCLVLAMVMLSAPRAVRAEPVMGLLLEARLGSTPDRVAALAGRLGVPVERYSYRNAGGLERGLIQSDLLGYLNQYGIRPAFLSDLEANQPEFITVRASSAVVTFCFTGGELWAVVAEIPTIVDTQVGGPGNPFDADRLRNLRAIVEQIRRSCPSVASRDPDSYGNVREWSGNCLGGTAQVRYDALRGIFVVLVHG